MKRYLLLSGMMLLLSACRTTAVNPDPNHTHMDFAVWINGSQLDFSGPEMMSGSSKDEPEDEHADDDHKHPTLHLHDGVGHVLHRHKPGLTLKEFFDSIKVGFDDHCYTSFMPMADGQICSEKWVLRMFVNGAERTPFDTDYVFVDLDRILITDATDGPELEEQLRQLTDDACLYSKTCPERGEPPAEGCVADPTVPCVE